MEKTISDVERLAVLAGLPNDFDDFDIEVVKMQASENGAAGAQSLIALRAVTNPDWCEGFKAQGGEFKTSTAAPSYFKDAPAAALTSKEMRAWAAAKSNTKPNYTRPLRAYRAFDSILKASIPLIAAFAFTLVYFIASKLGWAAGVEDSFITHYAWGWLPAAAAGFLLGKVFQKSEKARLLLVTSLPLSLLSLTSLLWVPITLVATVMVIGAHSKLNREVKKAETVIREDLSWDCADASTRFGSSVLSVQSASSSLRIEASNYGLTLKDASKVDLMASVVAGDAWLLAWGAQSFNQAASYGPDAIKSLGSILSRAAGTGGSKEELSVEGPLASNSTTEDVFKAITSWKVWVEKNSDPQESQLVWARVVNDLTCTSQNAPTALVGRLISTILL